MSPLHERACHVLPRLTADNYRPTSPATWTYNCIAWAVGVTDAWWWPIDGRFWPEGAPREETISAVFAALATVGFLPGTTADPESELKKWRSSPLARRQPMRPVSCRTVGGQASWVQRSTSNTARWTRWPEARTETWSPSWAASGAVIRRKRGEKGPDKSSRASGHSHAFAADLSWDAGYVADGPRKHGTRRGR
jgi:hypothetical protein